MSANMSPSCAVFLNPGLKSVEIDTQLLVSIHGSCLFMTVQV